MGGILASGSWRWLPGVAALWRGSGALCSTLGAGTGCAHCGAAGARLAGALATALLTSAGANHPSLYAVDRAASSGAASGIHGAGLALYQSALCGGRQCLAATVGSADDDG